MLVYAATKTEFLEDVRANRIDDAIHSAFRSKLGHSTSRSEVASWRNSMQYMHNVLLDPGIPNASGVAIEYRVPMTAKRIDFILTGKDRQARDSAVIIELKQWSKVGASAKNGLVETFVGGAVREMPHPSYQAWTYAALLEDYNEEVQTADIQLRPCAYLHNCSDGTVVRDPRYESDLARAPVYIKSDAERLTRFIKTYVYKGDQGDLLYRIDRGRIRPSKSLADHLASLLEGKAEFLMIDDQKVAYETVLSLAAGLEDGRKQVLLIEGGPGTGKSVVAVNLLVELTKLGRTVQYVTRNAAPRAVYESKLAGTMTKTRIGNLFRNSGAFTETEPDVFDCLLVDEAHRLNAKSGFYKNLGENQIKELINAARLTVFFLDAHQRVTLIDIGTAAEIRKWADRAGANWQKLQLASQFRCNGSNGYLSWVDNTLEIEATAVDTLEEIDFDFRVCESATELRDLILKANIAENKARLVAGYCWPWASKKDKSLMDIVLPEEDFEMQWNLDEDGSTWIMQPNSVDQIGCIHTCQGLELDYVGVILGPDLVVRDGEVITDPSQRAPQDSSVRGYKKLRKKDPETTLELTDRIIKNTYRTLLTRGQKGCYVYSVDPETNAFLQSKAGSSAAMAEASREPLGLRPHPFQPVPPEELRPFENAVPLYDLAIAAGVFSGSQDAHEAMEWVALPEDFRVQRGLFLSRVVGESMNRRIPNGSWCLFRANPAGTRHGRVVLAEHRQISDPDTGGHYTVKVYESRYTRTRDGRRSGTVILKPDSTDRRYEPIIFREDEQRDLRVLAEFVAVVG